MPVLDKNILIRDCATKQDGFTELVLTCSSNWAGIPVQKPQHSLVALYPAQDYAYLSTLCSFSKMTLDKKPRMLDAAQTLVQTGLYTHILQDNPEFPTEPPSNWDKVKYSLILNADYPVEAVKKAAASQVPAEQRAGHFQEIKARTEAIFLDNFGLDKYETLQRDIGLFYKAERAKGLLLPSCRLHP